MNGDSHVCLKVWGDLACFTRPEMKVERVSYDVMTPSAARGILEAILWKPQMCWRVREIAVLNKIRWLNLRRNEVGKKIPVGTVNTAMRQGSGALGLYVEDERQQRAGLLLKEVSYLIHADLELTDQAGPGDSLAKYVGMFKRRAAKGQCVHRPYLGCREFVADFALPNGNETPLERDADLGWMLYDLDFSGREPQPRFFRAEMRGGRIEIPTWDGLEVMR